MFCGQIWNPLVSIQLISPASGEGQPVWVERDEATVVSIQLISPASGEVSCVHQLGPSPQVSIQLISPASGECQMDSI